MTNSSDDVREPAPPEAAAEATAPDQPAESTPRPTRRSLLARQADLKRRNRPFLIGGLVVLALVLVIPTYGFVQKFVLPPRELALRVEDVEYTRGDLVKYIRFHQRLTEELGRQFAIGSSLFDALQTMADNEIAFQAAPRLGVTVEQVEIDRLVRSLLGFPGMTDEAAALPENKQQVDEKLRQFLNNTGLTEAEHRDIVRRDLFRSKVRDAIGQDVPRIQEQVHVYEIRLATEDKALLETIRRRLKAGEPITELAVRHSIDPNSRRNEGELGWMPRRVRPEFDRLFFSSREDGTRILPVGETSDLIHDPQARYWSTFMVSEVAPAREVSEAHFETLKDRAFADFVNEERKRLDVHLVLNDRIYNWVNQQVRIASILPSPTPADPLGALR